MTQFNVQQLLAAYGGTLVKSVQQVTITIAANATSGTASISSVVTGNSAPFYGGVSGPNTTINNATDNANIVLTNSTTVTANRFAADATNALTVVATIIEFSAGKIKSNQSGSITITSALTATATISSVVTGNSICIWNGALSQNNTSAGQPLHGATSVFLTNATTVTGTHGSSSFVITPYFTVLEFNSGVLNSSTQNFALTSTGTATTQTITSVTTSQAMIVWGGFSSSNASATQDKSPWATLTNGTTVTTNVHTASSFPTTCFTVVEFKASDIKSVNRGSINIGSGASSATATISSVNTGKCIANWLGQTNSSTSNNTLAHSFNTLVLTNATTVTAARNTTDTNTDTVGWETIEFN